MKKEKQFNFSKEILEIDQVFATQAEKLINQLGTINPHSFIAVDCVPDGELNAFRISNGLESARILNQLAGSFLADDLPCFEYRLWLARSSDFKLDLALGEKIGLWERIRQNDYQEKINWQQSFCVKNAKGITKIWHPNAKYLGSHGSFSTRSAIIRFILEEKAYLQKFYLPLPAPNGYTAWRMYYRLLFFKDSTQKEAELIGGIWISRPGFKIYLAPDSLVGLISPLTTVDIF